MPKSYLLEVGTAGDAPLLASFRSSQPFGSFNAGDQIVLIGDGGRLISHSIATVEHTVWLEGKAPVHKVKVLTS